MLLNEYKRNFYRLLNEGAAEQYRDAYYPEVDDYTLEKIIEVDPDSNGDNLSDFGKLLLKIKPQMSDFAQIKEDIAIYAKAVKNGVDVPEVRTVEELHYAAVDLANSNAHMSDDELSTMESSLGCPTVYNNNGVSVIKICNKEAASHYGKGTMWIWGANNGNMFEQYSQKGDIFVVIKGQEKYSIIKRGTKLRITDIQDNPVDKTIFPQDMLATLTGVNENKTIKISEKKLIKIISESVKKVLNEDALGFVHYGPREIIQMIDNGMFDDEVRKFTNNGSFDKEAFNKVLAEIVTKYNLKPMDKYVVAMNLEDRMNFVDSKVGSKTLYKQRDNAKKWDEEEWEDDKRDYLRGYDLKGDRHYTNDVSQHIPY